MFSVCSSSSSSSSSSRTANLNLYKIIHGMLVKTDISLEKLH